MSVEIIQSKSYLSRRLWSGIFSFLFSYEKRHLLLWFFWFQFELSSIFFPKILKNRKSNLEERLISLVERQAVKKFTVLTSCACQNCRLYSLTDADTRCSRHIFSHYSQDEDLKIKIEDCEENRCKNKSRDIQNIVVVDISFEITLKHNIKAIRHH